MSKKGSVISSPKYRTRRLPSFQDSQGRRITVRLDLITGELFFTRWSRRVLTLSMPDIFVLGLSSSQLESALVSGFSLDQLNAAVDSMESARRALLSASESVIEQTRRVAVSFGAVHREVLRASKREVLQ